MTADATQYLAVYGTLKPGERNHHVLSDVPGAWINGCVRGHLVDIGWGAAQGFPALEPDVLGPECEVMVLHSTELPRHLGRLDAFEGDEYRRVVVPVVCSDGSTIHANIYVAD